MDVVRGESPEAEMPIFEGTYFVANREIPGGEELLSSYRDEGWAEYDYYDSLENKIPLSFYDAQFIRGLK